MQELVHVHIVTEHRRRALEWLRADLTAVEDALKSGRAPIAVVRPLLRRYRTNRVFDCIRDAAVEKLPEAERPAFKSLWSDFDELLEAR